MSAAVRDIWRGWRELGEEEKTEEIFGERTAFGRGVFLERDRREDRAFTGGQDGGESKLGRREREGGKQRKKIRKKEKGATEREQREWEDIRD